MLCPKCGSDVGDNLHLCDKCEAERKESLEVEELAMQAQAEVTGHVSEAEDPGPAVAGDADGEHAQSGGWGKTIKTAAIGIVIFTVLLGAKVVMRQMSAISSNGSQSSDSGSSSSAAVPSLGSGSPFSPYLGEGRSGLRIGRTEIQLKKALALYNRSTRQLEIAFFREWNEPIDDSVLRRRGSLETVQGAHPDALLSLAFRGSDTTCGLGAIEEYHLTLFKNVPNLLLPGQQLAFPVKSVAGTLGPGVTTAFESLRCVFEDNAKIAGNFRGSRQFAVGDETQAASWDLNFDLPLIGPKTGADLIFDSRDAKATMALWNAATGELSVGFFGEELDVAEKEHIRRSGSYENSPAKKPDVVLTFTLAQGAHALNPANLKTYGVMFYRDRTRGFDFPGLDPEVGAFYVGSAQNSGSLKELSGDIAERSNVSGKYQHSVSKKVGVTEVRMRWNLQFHTPVMDTSIKNEAALEVTAKNEGPELNPGNSPYGVLEVDDAQAKIAAIVPLYYAKSGDLSIGFYLDEITAEERAEIIKRRTLSTYVNRKRPSLVLTLDFDENQTSFRRQDLKGYTMYFYRETGGSFNFPGFHEVVSLKRSADQIPEEELLAIDGSAGGNVKIRLKGDGQVTANPAMFRWDLSYELEPAVLR